MYTLWQAPGVVAGLVVVAAVDVVVALCVGVVAALCVVDCIVHACHAGKVWTVT